MKSGTGANRSHPHALPGHTSHDQHIASAGSSGNHMAAGVAAIEKSEGKAPAGPGSKPKVKHVKGPVY